MPDHLRWWQGLHDGHVTRKCPVNDVVQQGATPEGIRNGGMCEAHFQRVNVAHLAILQIQGCLAMHLCLHISGRGALLMLSAPHLKLCKGHTPELTLSASCPAPPSPFGRQQAWSNTTRWWCVDLNFQFRPLFAVSCGLYADSFSTLAMLPVNSRCRGENLWALPEQSITLGRLCFFHFSHCCFALSLSSNSATPSLPLSPLNRFLRGFVVVGLSCLPTFQ
mmetsp:Transcript_102877/g.199358  ORF Transcript_102877/g.199358 Transcript_102877/m.199358 type:complete len:221 (+) Transcript_102877:93-755(+)